MEDVKTEPVDFVREFQEYLTQQTQHVNMISGSVYGEKESGGPFQAVALRSAEDGPEPPSVEVSLSMEEGPDAQVESLERTCDGKYRCSYCSYANKGMARLIEHTRIHTGEKPHRCQLCPFASAYERHLEAHMRSHTGEKPYKCDLCAFRCSDRSNLSHHRRRRHKPPPARVTRSAFATKRILNSLQKRPGALGFGRRPPVSLTPPPAVGPPETDYLDDLSQKIRRHLDGGEHKTRSRADEGHARSRGAVGPTLGNPLDQLSALAGQLADLHPTPDGEPSEQPIVIEQVFSEHAVRSRSVRSFPLKDSPPSAPGGGSPAPDLGFGSNTLTNSQPSTPDPQLLHQCQHCDVHFLDNILYTIHMGCHGYEHPFQCNICGHLCGDRYDFACHFARGQHRK